MDFRKQINAIPNLTRTNKYPHPDVRSASRVTSKGLRWRLLRDAMPVGIAPQDEGGIKLLSPNRNRAAHTCSANATITIGILG